MIQFPVRDKGSNADDRVVYVLRKFVADRLADFYVGLADEIVSGGEALYVGNRFEVPNDDVCVQSS